MDTKDSWARSASSDKACIVSSPTKIPIHGHLNKILYIHPVECYAFVKKNMEVLYLMIWHYLQDGLLSGKKARLSCIMCIVNYSRVRINKLCAHN